MDKGMMSRGGEGGVSEPELLSGGAVSVVDCARSGARRARRARRVARRFMGEEFGRD
jgi:hypothetical protein